MSLHLKELLALHPELNIKSNDYNINVTANYGTKLSSQELEHAFQSHPGSGLPTHLYFHVPLCNYICHFCNYVKKKLSDVPASRAAALDQWCRLLIDESNRHLLKFNWIKQALIESFYIGGGTAAVFELEHLGCLMEHVKTNYKLTKNAELSLEGNPDNFVNGLIEDAIKLGFNRFSLGVQSLQDNVLKFVGRKHDAAMCIEAIKQLNFARKPYNVDYMFGMPYQTVEAIVQDIKKLVELNVPTITIYRLRNADREAMGIGNQAKWNNLRVQKDLHKQGSFFPSLEETYNMREAIVKIFLQYDYFPSPCGWWSKRNTYQNGNIPKVSHNKWQRYDSMLAYGPGAYGWLTGHSKHVVQTHNITHIADYIKVMETSDLLPFSYGRLLTSNESLAARLGFGFKANQPIMLAEYQERFGVDLLGDNPIGQIVNELLEKEFIELDANGSFIKPTLKGEALHEEIISIYLHHRIGGITSELMCNKFLNANNCTEAAVV